MTMKEDRLALEKAVDSGVHGDEDVRERREGKWMARIDDGGSGQGAEDARTRF